MNSTQATRDTKPLILYSWGYWGWGSTTKQFVESVDLVEKARGFNPPLFVDVRLRRSVRAPGFREAAFQQVTGADRYVWMNSLGNKNVGTGDDWELKDPKAVAELLKLAAERSRDSRRVIFYCACQTPVECHRSLVAETLIKVAKDQKRQVSVVEWPGTELPESPLVWNPSSRVLSAVEKGRRSIDLPAGVTLTEAASMAWYTPVILMAEGSKVPVLVGPAVFQRDAWVVPVLEGPLEPESSSRDMRRAAVRRRAELGYDHHGAAPGLQR